jgi:hypothetical protein
VQAILLGVRAALSVAVDVAKTTGGNSGKLETPGSVPLARFAAAARVTARLETLEKMVAVPCKSKR